MKTIFFSIFLVFLMNSAYGNKLDGYNIYFAGALKHFDTAPENNEGNMEYLALSKDLKKGNWMFETGAGTYIDSYHKRSYIFFSNISHDKYTYNWFKPMLSLACTYKGEELYSNSREVICAPLPKLRIGKSKGLFTNLTFVPKLKKLTNGFIAIEFAYKF